MRTDHRPWLAGLAALVLAACHGTPAATDVQPATVVPVPAAAPAAAAETGSAEATVLSDWELLMPEDGRALRPPPVIGGPRPWAPAVQGGLMDDNGSGTPPGVVIDHSGNKRAEQFGSSEVVAGLAGRALALDGYVVPLQGDDQGRVSELLFVPYYGACIHVPPPPPNQIIHVILAQPVAVPELSDAFRLTGTLRIARFQADIANAAYEVLGAHVTRMAQ